MKKCSKCKIEKEDIEFSRSKNGKNGRCSVCKKCFFICYNIKRRVPKKINIKYITIMSPELRALKNLISKKSRLKHPIHTKARSIISHGIRDGKIIRQPCVHCGSIKSQAHHPDYSKPLEVIWVCSKHHRLYHTENWI